METGTGQVIGINGVRNVHDLVAEIVECGHKFEHLLYVAIDGQGNVLMNRTSMDMKTMALFTKLLDTQIASDFSQRMGKR